ncbi:MAG: 50S ribosomal protein L10 [Pyrinomonadaceae bacterium]|nr:50S ribosomal protein L10 [Pyrinomonadaceae bacterium]
MKTREKKQEDLDALIEQFDKASAALFVGFNKLTVSKDQELREKLREVGAIYRVVKNTIVAKAIEGKPYESAKEKLVGMTAVATSEKDAVQLSKTLSKFIKDNSEIFSFKIGIVEGQVVDLKAVEEIANLPSREELISKIMFVINYQAQGLVTVLNAVPRNLAVVVQQIGDKKEGATSAE